MNKKEYFVENLRKVIRRNDLKREESFNCLKFLLDHEFGIANDSCFGAFFAAMQTKGPTSEEIAGLMDVVLNYDRKPLSIERKFNEPLCGIIGSGKDDVKTFNISSISSIVGAAAGGKIIKNGSRSEASVAGTTDVFEELGLDIAMNDKTKFEKALNMYGFGFCDVAPYFPKMLKEYMGKFFFVHPLSYILPIASGVEFDRVVFGLASDATEKTAELLLKLGYDNSLVVAGHDKNGKNFDEISNIGKTKISEIKNGKIETYFITPEDFGMKTYDSMDISEGKSVKENAKIFKDIIDGVEKGAKLDVILLNSGALIYTSGIAKDIKEGISIAREAIKSGKAREVLENVIKIYNE